MDDTTYGIIVERSTESKRTSKIRKRYFVGRNSSFFVYLAPVEKRVALDTQYYVEKGYKVDELSFLWEGDYLYMVYVKETAEG